MGTEHTRAPRRAVEPCEEGQGRGPRIPSLLQAKEDQRRGMEWRKEGVFQAETTTPAISWSKDHKPNQGNRCQMTFLT